jgi:hypothetical protein
MDSGPNSNPTRHFQEEKSIPHVCSSSPRCSGGKILMRSLGAGAVLPIKMGRTAAPGAWRDGGVHDAALAGNFVDFFSPIE